MWYIGIFHSNVDSARLWPVLTRMTICFQFEFVYFVQFDLHLIGRKVNLQAVISKRIKFDKKPFRTFSFDFLVHVVRVGFHIISRRYNVRQCTGESVSWHAKP